MSIDYLRVGLIFRFNISAPSSPLIIKLLVNDEVNWLCQVSWRFTVYGLRFHAEWYFVMSKNVNRNCVECHNFDALIAYQRENTRLNQFVSFRPLSPLKNGEIGWYFETEKKSPLTKIKEINCEIMDEPISIKRLHNGVESSTIDSTGILNFYRVQLKREQWGN